MKKTEEKKTMNMNEKEKRTLVASIAACMVFVAVVFAASNAMIKRETAPSADFEAVSVEQTLADTQPTLIEEKLEAETETETESTKAETAAAVITVTKVPEVVKVTAKPTVVEPTTKKVTTTTVAPTTPVTTKPDVIETTTARQFIKPVETTTKKSETTTATTVIPVEPQESITVEDTTTPVSYDTTSNLGKWVGHGETFTYKTSDYSLTFTKGKFENGAGIKIESTRPLNVTAEMTYRGETVKANKNGVLVEGVATAPESSVAEYYENPAIIKIVMPSADDAAHMVSALLAAGFNTDADSVSIEGNTVIINWSTITYHTISYGMK